LELHSLISDVHSAVTQPAMISGLEKKMTPTTNSYFPPATQWT
jgi:hypothetical protein